MVGWDVETTVNGAGRVPTMIAFAADAEPGAWHLIADLAGIQAELDRPAAAFLTCNGAFDHANLDVAGLRPPPEETWDDLNIYMHLAGLREGNLTSLKGLSARLFGAEVLEPAKRVKARMREQKLPADRMGEVEPEVLGPYCAIDAELTVQCRERLLARIREDQAPILELEPRCFRAVVQVNRRGVPVDLDAVAPLVAELAPDLKAKFARAQELGCENVRSYRKVHEALLARGAPEDAFPVTRKGNRSTEKHVLLEVNDELARLALAYRGLKFTHDQVRKIPDVIRDGRVHPQFKSIGSRTGRMSCPGAVNFHNWRKGDDPDSDVRPRALVAAEEGKDLAGADLEGIERVLLGYLAGEEAILEEYRAGENPHDATAARLDIPRQQAKALNFGLPYGQQPRGLAARLGCPLERAAWIYDRFWESYPAVASWVRELERTVAERGYLQTPAGRRHAFKNPHDHRLISTMVSGMAADLFKAAVVELHRLRVPMILLVHDEVVAEVNPAQADEVGALIVAALTRGTPELNAVVQLRAEAHTGKTWADLK